MAGLALELVIEAPYLMGIPTVSILKRLRSRPSGFVLEPVLRDIIMTFVSTLKRLWAGLSRSEGKPAFERNTTAVDPCATALALQLSDGNPGAYNLMMALSKRAGGEALELIEGIEALGLRGSSIWGGYKRHCKEDLDAFIQAIRSRDMVMVRTALNR